MSRKAIASIVLVLSSGTAVCEAAWQRRAISDGVRSHQNGQPSAGREGVAWVGQGNRALLLWDRDAVQVLVGALEPTAPNQDGFLRPISASTSSGGFSSVSLSNGAVAYSTGWTDSEREIHLWRQGAAHRITYNQFNDEHPCLYASFIAWDNYPPACSPWPCTPEDSEIWFWNGYGAWQITDNDVEDACPSLYELSIAWESDGNVVYTTIPHPEWGRALTPTFVAEGQRPSLFENQIAYQASDGSDREIFLYEIDSNQIRQITDNPRNDGGPRLYDGTILWEGDDGHDLEVFYWDGVRTQQITDNEIDDIEPTLWGTGLDTTIGYVERWWDGALLSRVICLRPAATASVGGSDGAIALTWPSLEGRAYRVEYSDDLVNWKVAAESVPSAGYGETSWTDGPDSGTIPPPSEVLQRFYRVCESE